MNKHSELEIFKLCERLAELLGDEEAIADLNMLLERHPEMFVGKEQVYNLIKKVVNDPEIIIKNPTPKSDQDYIAGSRLNEQKMGEIGIRKDENISKIYHANEKNIKKIGQLDKKEVIYKKPMVGTPTSYTQAQSLDERLVQKNISSAMITIISHNVKYDENDCKKSKNKNIELEL